MAWYDRLRGDGAAPLDAMREALPLFARAPRARPGDPAAERRGLPAQDGPGAASWDSGADDPVVAESFPCTAADAVTAATGTIQAAPSAARANTTVQIRQPGRSA